MVTDLNELTGMEVDFELDGDIIPCEIVHSHLDTYCFEEKNEQMNVFLSLQPLDYKTNTSYEQDDFSNVCISYVRKRNKKY